MVLELTLLDLQSMFTLCDTFEKTHIFIEYLEILKNAKIEVSTQITQGIIKFFKTQDEIILKRYSYLPNVIATFF